MVNNNGFPDPTELVRKQREAHKKESLKETLATWRAEAKYKKPVEKPAVKGIKSLYLEVKKKKVRKSFIVSFEGKKKKFEKGIKSLARKRVRLPSAPKRVAKKYIVGKRLTFRIGRVR